MSMTGQPARRGEKILIIGPSWVGDMVMAQALFIRLKQLEPGCSIDVLAPAWSRPLLERMPEVSRPLDWPFGHGELNLRGRYSLGRELRDERYDRVIVLPNSFKSALVPRFAGIPRRTGWRGEMRGWLLNDCRVLDPSRYPLMVERFVALATEADSALPDPLPRPALHTHADAVSMAMHTLDLQQGCKVLALCPGAEFGDAKQWPARHYSALAQYYLQQGWQVWLFGSEKDAAITAVIDKGIEAQWRSRCRDLAGRTTLGQAIDLLSVADAVVTNDSGLMHVAAALNRPVLALYGSTSPDFTPPMADRVKLLASDITCRPCFKRECPLEHKACLVDMESEYVVQQLQDLLTGDGAAGRLVIKHHQ